jgi:hypothetical protein
MDASSPTRDTRCDRDALAARGARGGAAADAGPNAFERAIAAKSTSTPANGD